MQVDFKTFELGNKTVDSRFGFWKLESNSLFIYMISYSAT